VPTVIKKLLKQIDEANNKILFLKEHKNGKNLLNLDNFV
jgi:hypothetical protein